MLRPWVAGTGLALTAGVAAELVGARAFARLVRDDAHALERCASAFEARLVGEAMLAGLPEPVQRYLRYTGVVGKPLVRRVHLRQKGRMQLGRGLPWIPLEAEQWHSVRPPGFVWDGTLHVGPVPVVRARDITATLLIAADGRLTEFVGRRYAGGKLATWSVPVTAYGELAGLRLPIRCKAVWRLDRGDRAYVDVTITELHHDV